MGRHRGHVCSRVRGRGRHRAFRCCGVAVGAWRRVRTVPDLQQRTVALRTAPPGDRSWLPSQVCRPHARSEDAAVIGAFGRSRPDLDDFQPPTLETLRGAVARNWRSPGRGPLPGSWRWSRRMGTGTGPARSRGPRSPPGRNGLARQTPRPSHARQVSPCRSRTPQGRMDLSPRPSSFSWPSSGLGAREEGEAPTHGMARPMGGCNAR